jgi:RNA polymerase sigma-70 factor (ECF subfamily)
VTDTGGTPAEPTVEALLGRAVAGDRGAAGELVTRFDERLRRIVRARLDPRVAQRVDADDVLQETHVEALSRLGDYAAAEPRMPLFLWLRFLAVQRCAALARRHLLAGARDARREVVPATPTDGSAPSDEHLAHHLAASMTSPSASVARSEVHERLRQALETLEPSDRDVLWLRHFEALDNREVADVLGIETAAASKRYVRALARLKERLGPLAGGPGAAHS